MHNLSLRLNELLDQEIVLEIEKLAFGGYGISRYNSIVIFVPFSAPGDKLKVKITEIKKNHAIGEILELLSSGPCRVMPECSVYGKCGGCDWQHLSYAEQLASKQQIVHDFISKVYPHSFKFHPIMPSPKPFRYRNRAQFKFQKNDFGKSLFGFYERGSHKIVDINNCLLLEEPLTKQIALKRLELESGQAKELSKVELSLFNDERTEEFNLSGFTQVNRFQNELLIETILSWANVGAFDQIFDLYAGSGNFTFPLFQKFKNGKTIGVEMHSGAVQIARNQISKQNISPKKLEFYCADIELFLRRQVLTEQNKKTFVLLDPPRIGCSDFVIRSLAKNAPEKIIYISCDPAALARDLKRFFAASIKVRNNSNDSIATYRITQAQCFDMFPQTHHVETVVELARTF